MSEIHGSIRETEIAAITGIDRLKLKTMRGVEGTDWFRAEGSGRPVWWSREAFEKLTGQTAVQSEPAPAPVPEPEPEPRSVMVYGITRNQPTTVPSNRPVSVTIRA